MGDEIEAGTQAVQALRVDRESAVEAASSTAAGPRSGIALCLSGGGFRASIFHLGVLRRLDEIGLLRHIKTISAVSGGSITAAFIAARWPDTSAGKNQIGPLFSQWNAEIATRFFQFTKRDIRTGPILRRVLPWNWFRPAAGVRALMGKYEKYLTPKLLSALPTDPCFIFCSTDMLFGVSWIFQRDRVGDWMAGYCEPPPPNWTVARAVAASSCFPPIFSPLPMDLPGTDLRNGRASKQKDLLRQIALTDGGVYDNMGLEPVWKTHEYILVSDGGGHLSFRWTRDPFGEIMRYPAIIQNQALALRQRWLVSNYEMGVMKGALWRIAGASENPGAYSKEFALNWIATIRTDLDGFTEAETAVLENHGYLQADAAIQRRVPQLLPPRAAPLQIPNPQWMDEIRAQQGLRDSAKRFSWTRIARRIMGRS